MRSAMLDVLTADYIEVARSKGLSERRIMIKHVLRNALIPTITVCDLSKRSESIGITVTPVNATVLLFRRLCSSITIDANL